MILTTRCPACATRFRVVPDQLKIGQGWVRCGQCQQVFDARVTLQEVSPLGAGAPQPDPVLQIDPPLHVSAPEAGRQPQPDPETDQTPENTPAPAGTALPPLDDLRAEPDPARDLSFMRQARQRASWHQPRVRGALMLAAFMFTLLLVGQWLVHHRDRVAVQAPGLKPLLAAWCRSAGCELRPPRRIDQLAIDGSSFTRLQPDAYRLVLTLANQATTPVAMPAIELTLTDSQDKPVLRRVLMPSELGADTPDRLAGGGEWSVTLTLGLSGAVGAERIAGYRVLAFYP